jgi:hypothetical protein
MKIHDNVHHRLKIAAANAGRTITELGSQLINLGLKSPKKLKTPKVSQ